MSTKTNKRPSGAQNKKQRSARGKSQQEEHDPALFPRPKGRMRPIATMLLRRVSWFCLICAFVVLLLLSIVEQTTRGLRYEHAADLPAARVAMVFGAGVRPDGRLSPMLADRVDAAVELYQLGRVQRLLMTGDNSRTDYDEVSAMRAYAEQRGIPGAHITLDYAGFSTYESCYRAGPIFGVSDAILITQRYHLPRAVYTCRALGMQVHGLASPDWERYPASVMLPYTIREYAATLKALWQLHISRPLPTFLGPYEGIP